VEGIAFGSQAGHSVSKAGKRKSILVQENHNLISRLGGNYRREIKIIEEWIRTDEGSLF
jgi:hypothetical protein